MQVNNAISFHNLVVDKIKKHENFSFDYVNATLFQEYFLGHLLLEIFYVCIMSISCVMCVRRGEGSGQFQGEVDEGGICQKNSKQNFIDLVIRFIFIDIEEYLTFFIQNS